MKRTMKRPATPATRNLLAGLFAASLVPALAGCAGMSENETAGTILGGVAGAVVGNQFGDGDGKTAATALGAIIGATVGREIGHSLDQTSRRRADAATRRALDTASVGEGITWENPANAGGPARGTAKITRHGADRQGRTCREYHQTVVIGGKEVQSYGTACRDDNGDWKIVSA